jgi:TonB family protein
MTPLAQAISTALLQFIWQGILVACGLWAALFLLRNRSANLRYVISCGALAVLLILPAATAYSLYDSSFGSSLGSARPSGAALTLTIRAVWSGSIETAPAWLTAIRPWIVWVWLAGVALLSLQLAWAGGQLAILRRLATPADAALVEMASNVARRLGTCRVVRVLIAATSEGPSLTGWIRPAVMLPVATLMNLTPEQLESILAHEIAHLRRYDDIVNIFQTFIETLLFYHPAVWWVSNRIRHERELCCDDLAVATCGDALCYARALTTLEKLRLATPRLALGANQSPLAYRIRRVVGSRTQEYLPSSLPGVVALCFAIACFAINTRPAVGAAPAPARVEYPEAARARGIQGTVPVEVKIDASGKVSEAHAVGGPQELRRAAEQRALGELFTGPMKPATQKVDVAFQLAQQATPAENPRPDAAVDERTLGTIEGVVLSERGKPLSKSTVTLYPWAQQIVNIQPVAITTTDSSGKFVFERLKPQTYTLTGEHPGYLMGVNGSKRTTQLLAGFTAIDVGASQHVSSVSIELTAYSTITGKVVDEDGDPMAKVMVNALSFRWAQNGRERVPIGNAQTDDRGEFKLSDMGPGRVYLSFSVPNGGPLLQERIVAGRAEERYVTTYYPGTTDLKAASMVTVSAGLDVTGVNMKLKKSPVYHVRGTVAGGSGPFTVFLKDGATQNILAQTSNGKFDGSGVAPGDYLIGGVASDGRMLPFTPLRVSDRDADISLSMLPSEKITGRVKLMEATQGASQISLKGIQLTLTPATEDNYGQPPTAMSGDDGSFAIPNVSAGKYVVSLNGLPAGCYWKSRTLGGQDVSDTHAFDFSGGAGGATFEIGISTAAANVTLTVSIEKNESPQTVLMVLPDPPQPGHNWLYKRAPANAQGRYTFSGLPPGNYRVFATETIERFLQFDPDWYKAHESRGTKITVKENDHLQLTLPRASSAQLADDDKRAGR